MVVACRTQHLIKTSKNMTISKKISFSTSSLPFVNRNYLNYTKNVPSIISKSDTLVRLCYACRRFHSTGYYQTSRESRAALTPQEILLINTNSVFSLDLSESLDRVRRAILSENPAEELNNVINQDLARSNVQSYVKSLVPESIANLQRTLTSEDLLESLVRKYTADPRILRAASNSDLQSVLDVLNYEIGGRALVVSNSSVVIDVDAIEGLLRSFVAVQVQRLYPENIYIQIVTRSLAEQQIRSLSSNLRSSLTSQGIPIELLNEVISLLSSPNRAKRDVITDLVLEILRPQIAAILTPIQVQVDTVLDGVVQILLSFYTSTLPEDAILATITSLLNVGIIRISEIVVVVKTNVDSIFDNLINGTTVSSARRRRDIDLEFENYEYYDLENVALELSHKRVTRDIVTDVIGSVTGAISGIFLPITSTLNTVAKNVIIFILSAQYVTIGGIVTLPFRIVLNIVIDAILPCDVCVSIV